MTNLNALIPPGSGWDLKSAADINEPGQMVAYGKTEGDGDVDLADRSALLAIYGTTCD